eukprot:3418967-Prymnesium_polylepis.1
MARCIARKQVLTRMATTTRACSACSLIMSTQPGAQRRASVYVGSGGGCGRWCCALKQGTRQPEGLAGGDL